MSLYGGDDDGRHDRASALLVLTNPLESAMTQPVGDLGLVQREIANSEVSVGKGDLPATIARARKILDAVNEPNKEIFIISDLQKNSWATVLPKQGEKLSKIPVIVMNCGSKDRSNAGITEVNLRARSRVEGEPVTIEARLFNFGGKAISQTATLYVDGQSRDRRRVTLAPGVPTAVSFSYTFAQPGVHRGSVMIEDDRLKADNVRSFCISIQEQLKVLIVQDEVAAVDFHDDSFYLIRALDPLAGLADVRSPIHPLVITADRLQGEKLSDYRAVFLVNLTHISQPVAAELKQYVRSGGGLVIFAGDKADVRTYNEMLADPADAVSGGLMPAEFGEKIGDADDRTRFRTISSVDYTHRLLARFKGEGIFSDVRVYQNILAKVAGRSASALIALSDGSPFLIENTYQNGKVLMFTVSANADWSNFPIRQSYLPLLHETTYYLSRMESGKDSYLVGSPVRFSFNETPTLVQMEVTDPGGKVYKVDSQVMPKSNAAAFTLTSRPGVYSWKAEKTEHGDGAFAVNPDTRESDLQQADDATANGACKAEKVFVVASLDEMYETIKRLREGLPLVDYFFLVVLAIAIFECFFSNWLTPSASKDVGKNKLGLVMSTSPAEK